MQLAINMRYLFVILCCISSGYFALSLRNSTSRNDWGLRNSTTRNKETNDVEDYYSNYDYELTVNMTEENIKSDSLILPNPEFLDPKFKNTVDLLPNIELPSESLADSDLRDHDFIDNLMYIYYGSNSKTGTSFGSEIIIVGSVLSCAAQLLTIFCALLRKNTHGKRDISKIFMHMIGSLCFANLVFMLGVYATKSALKCQIIAIILHYLHLLTAFWIFLHCYYICKRFSAEYLPKLIYFCLLAYGTPILIVMISYVIAPHSYETKQFCFVSVQKGMLINYMLPVSILIVATTFLALNGIRKVNLELSKLELTSSESLNALKTEDTQDGDKRLEIVAGEEEVASLREFKNSLKTLSLVQTSYDVVWFIAVLALENGFISNVMPVLYAMSSCFLNWYMFAKSKSFVPSMYGIPERAPNEDTEKGETSEKPSVINPLESVSRCSSSDNIPLLNNTDCYTELRELRHDTISTISS